MDVFQLRYILIMLHAAAGAISFFAGLALIFLPQYLSNRRLFALYSWSLIGLVVFLAGAMIVFWTNYSNPERIIFTGLFGLALYMLSLFEGFIIVAALNAGSPGWFVGLLAVLGVFAGRWVIGVAQRRAV
jgi:hypothetical protein